MALIGFRAGRVRHRGKNPLEHEVDIARNQVVGCRSASPVSNMGHLDLGFFLK